MSTKPWKQHFLSTWKQLRPLNNHYSLWHLQKQHWLRIPSLGYLVWSLLRSTLSPTDCSTGLKRWQRLCSLKWKQKVTPFPRMLISVLTDPPHSVIRDSYNFSPGSVFVKYARGMVRFSWSMSRWLWRLVSVLIPLYPFPDPIFRRLVNWLCWC